MQNKVMSSSLKKYCCSSFDESDYVRIKVVGIINTVAFQKARICAEKLHQHLSFKFASPQIVEMFQVDWHEYMQKMKRKLGGKIWSLARTVAVFMNNEFLGSDLDFLRYISQTYIFNLPIEAGYYENLAEEQSKRFMENSKRKFVYFTFSVDGSTIGSFVFMLYSDLLPLTCQHFLNLCTGYNEITQCYEESFYLNTCVHRIVKNGWLQCGDIDLSTIDKDSIDDNVLTIPDESYCIPHDRRGVLSMTNDGKHSNKFQFVVCLKSNSWMNCYYVAFGQLVDGARTLEALENIATYYEHPTKRIVISNCGEFILGDEAKMETDSEVFLKYKPSSIEGEAPKRVYSAFDFYSIKPWLENIVDKIDVRDTASLLMAERYLNGLYCLSTDHLPGMDMRLYDEIRPIARDKYDSVIAAMLRELLMKFHPDKMTTHEKLMLTSDISKIILAYVFYHTDTEFCLKHISTATREVIHKILEVAQKIAMEAVTQNEKMISISHKCGTLKVHRIFEAKQVRNVLISEGCISLLQDILTEAILYLLSSFVVLQE